MSPLRLVGICCVALLCGCSTFMPVSCERFEAESKKTNYATEYRLKRDETGALGKNESAKAAYYQIELDSGRVRPCSHVGIGKELVLLRRDRSDLIFEETREFFAGDGTRIVTKNETLTGQLAKSGRYQAKVLLPIPSSAPAGKYRIVSTISVRTKNGGAATVLAKSSASFEVVAAK